MNSALYDINSVMWPDLKSGRETLRAARVGVDRKTLKPLIGWPHTHQSMGVIFSTRFHERVLRRWVGSFVPHILGDNTTERVVGRFYWAIATALDLWEPNYRIQQVNVVAATSGRPLNSPEQIRLGNLEVQHVGIHRPRGHLGDVSPDQRKPVTILYNNGVWR